MRVSEMTQNEPIAIAFVTSELFPVTRGGAGRLLYLAAGELLKRGHRVHVLLDGPEEQAKEFRLKHRPGLPNCEAMTIQSMAELGHANPPSAGPASWYEKKSQQWYLSVKAMLDTVKPDVVEFLDFYGFGHTAIAAHRWMGFGSGAKFVLRSHLTMEQIQQCEIGGYVDRTALLMHEQERLALENADAVLTASASYARAFARKYNLPAEKVVVSDPPLGEMPKPKAVSGECDTVLFVARLFHFKGADIFVDAAVRMLEEGLPDHVRFVMVGYDSNMAPGLAPFEQYLRKRIPSRLAHRIEFTGHLTPQEVSQWLARSICYVCPSREESFAYTVHEAAGAGVPLVLSNLPAFEDFFRDGEDCLKFDGSSGDLASKIRRVITDGALRGRLAKPQHAVKQPLGTAYENLAARARQATRSAAVPRSDSDILAVILKGGAGTSGNWPTAQQAIKQAWPGAKVVTLEPAATDAKNTLPLFGRLWAVQGEPITAKALMICCEHDRFDEAYLRQAAEALLSNDGLGFVAPSELTNSANDWLGLQLDTSLAIWPVVHAIALTRCLLRTPEGVWLADLLDRRVEAYGEIGYLWSLQDRGLGGLQWPSAGAVFGQTDITLADSSILESMLLRGGNSRRAVVQSRFLAQSLSVEPARPLVGPPSLKQRILGLFKTGR